MKRFTDTAKFDDSWYSELPLVFKLAWDYLLAKCDSAGIWEPNFKLAAFQIGGKVDWPEFQRVAGPRLAVLPNGKWWVTTFVRFQYGRLSREAKVHLSVLRNLEKNGIEVSEDGIPIPLESPLTKDKEKDKVKEEGSAEGNQEPPAEPKPRKDRGTLEEITAFCVELKLPACDGAAMFHKWEGNGWKNGTATIKDWRATIRSWQASGYMPSQKNGNGNGSAGSALSPIAARKAADADPARWREFLTASGLDYATWASTSGARSFMRDDFWKWERTAK